MSNNPSVQSEREHLTRILFSASLHRAVCTVAELGIADLIEPGVPRPVSELAGESQSHERALYRLLRFLASYDFFEEKSPGCFDHTKLSDHLRSNVSHSFRSAARMAHTLFPAWDGLHHSVKTGEPGFNPIFGKSLFEYLKGQPERAALFDQGMTEIHGHETESMLNAYDFSGINILADIGGGNGSLLASVLQHYSSMHAILFDLDHVIERAGNYLKKFSLTGRCDMRGGDFFKSLPDGADAYLFRHVLHDWTDEQCIRILQNCRQVIPDHGRVLIVECVIPTGNTRSLALDFDMAMLVFPGGMERSGNEFSALCGQAGFAITRIVPTSSAVSIVEAIPC